jgi:hypothetical protein
VDVVGAIVRRRWHTVNGRRPRRVASSRHGMPRDLPSAPVVQEMLNLVTELYRAEHAATEQQLVQNGGQHALQKSPYSESGEQEQQ